MKWQNLIRSTKPVSPTSISENFNNNIIDLDLGYDERHQIMTFVGKIRGSSGSLYEWQIDFLDVEKTLNLTPLEIQEARFPKPSLAKNDIKVFCNCPQFRYTFSNANIDNRAETGPNFPGFINKSHRASRNPNQNPGVCKHIVSVVNYLKNNGFIF